uniref:EamA domain-containing protein n=1 Tax=Steinernema glaseri TaxID=37863 RepID=A0A1I7Y579_9BILA
MPWTSETITCLVLSALLHMCYSLSLQKGYQVADLSVVYPIARGTGPMLSSIGAFILLGEPVRPLGVLGILLVPCSANGRALGHANRDTDCGLHRGGCVWGQGVADLAVLAGLVQQCAASGDAGSLYRQARAGRFRQVQTLLEAGGGSGFVIAHVLHPGLAGSEHGGTPVHGGPGP